MHRRFAAIAVTAILGTCSSAGSASAYTDMYVALGDSYASGTGTRSYYNDDCERSLFAYPQLLLEDWPRKPPKADGTVLRNLTCGGAKTSTVLNSQVPWIPGNTSYVSITIGGNDANFSGVIGQCAKPWPTTCWGDIDEAQEFIREVLPARLGNVYREIRERAPWAHVIAVGYPRLFGPEECNGAGAISEGEQRELNETADLLRNVTKWMAAASGSAFYFVDAIPAFRGHAICSDSEWLNGVSNPKGESFHPNRDGHRRGYLPLMRWTIAATG
jgi:lysophospholipase L1-like esterase